MGANTFSLHNRFPYPFFSLSPRFYRYFPFPSGINNVRWQLCCIFERAMCSDIFRSATEVCVEDEEEQWQKRVDEEEKDEDQVVIRYGTNSPLCISFFSFFN